MNDNTIRPGKRLPVSINKARELLKGKKHISDGWRDHVPIEPKEGGAFREEWFDSVNRVLTPGTITIFDPPSKLTVAWAVDDWPGDTVVTFSSEQTTMEHGSCLNTQG